MIKRFLSLLSLIRRDNEINWVFAQIALEMYFMKYWHLSTVKNKIMDNLTMNIYHKFKDVGST